MTPLFKSHFSLGNSLLTLEKINELGKEEGEIMLVEDNLSSLRKAKKKLEVPFCYSLRISCKGESNDSKVIFAALGDEGIDTLRRIYTKAFTESDGVFEIGSVELKGVSVLIPFYDSFIHKTIHYFGDYSLPKELTEDATFLEEDNNHPFDFQISKRLKDLGIKTQKTKSIYYEKYDHFPSFQCYKANCNRKMGRKPPSFGNPQLEAMCSNKFCWEDFKNEKNTK